jgi:hypothetical protein
MVSTWLPSIVSCSPQPAIQSRSPAKSSSSHLALDRGRGGGGPGGDIDDALLRDVQGPVILLVLLSAFRCLESGLNMAALNCVMLSPTGDPVPLPSEKFLFSSFPRGGALSSRWSTPDVARRMATRAPHEAQTDSCTHVGRARQPAVLLRRLLWRESELELLLVPDVVSRE